MYRAIQLFIIFCFSVSALVGQQAPAIEWQRTLGGSDDEECYSVKALPNGNIISAGYTESNDGDIVSSPFGFDAWVVMLDSLGQLIWENSYGSVSYHDVATSIDLTSDGGFIITGTKGTISSPDLWVIKINSLGSLQWERTYGGSSSDYGISITQLSNGGYIAVGSTNSNDGDVSFNSGSVDLWILRLDSIGNLLWQQSLGGSNEDEGYSVVETYDKGYAITGYSNSSDGDLTYNYGGRDLWMIKLDSSGVLQWQSSFGGSNAETGLSLIQTSDSGFIAIGESASNDGQVTGNQGSYDCWILKVNKTGSLQWQSTLGGAGVDRLRDVSRSSTGENYAIGYSSSTAGDVTNNHGFNDFWVIKIDTSGNLSWQKPVGGSLGEIGYSISCSSQDDLVLAGWTNSSDGDVTGNNGESDFWIVKLTSDFAQLNGSIFADLNSDNMQGAGEPALSNRKIENLNSGFQFFSDTYGSFFVAAIDTGATTISPNPIPHYTSNPINHSEVFATLNQQIDSLNDFAMQPNGVFNDLCVTISPIGVYRPGFPCQYSIDYTNVGTTTLTPTVVFFPDPLLVYDSASATASSVTPDSVVWSLPPLAPFQTGQISAYLTLDMNAGLGATLNSWVRIEPLIGDANVSNNSETWEVITQGAYDPNDILVDQESILFQNMSPVPPDLTYIIRFQNTGTDTAFTVRIENDVPDNVDLNTFQFEASSHPIQINYLQHTNRMEYRFDNILLPDSNTNEAASHGYIRYRIKPKSTLMIGDSVLNDARIYFDFNAPIETNTAVTVIETSTAISELESSTSMLSPNPTIGNVLISLPKPDQGQIQLFDATGKLIESSAFNGQNMNVDISHLPSGMYTVLVAGEHSTWEEKVVKQ